MSEETGRKMEESSSSSVIRSEENDDRFWLVAAKNGNKNAYGKLVLKYQRKLVRLIFMLLGRIDKAEDVVQEALVKGYLALDSFEINRPFYPWIATIARNIALNQLKRDEKIIAFSDTDESKTDIPDYSKNPLEAIIEKENDRSFALAVQNLPAPYRIVFVLRTVEKMSYEDIAQKLNISVGTVNSRLSRAREKLVEMLREHW